ncbi:CRISPR-associated endonuclease Cas3'' (plasmid) [Halarchaeum sp. CBA1220]|uniref:CRISPR-associated endonuclease Cas3'' n=1 Tax=Halarchaeum sp. CBA1220 TaxID=1853682 RepID=UPI000F3A954A|nr:CRISPR-associated endonuclease Cas3'' [Halarchaeum sp. CBA1220]QLC35052.1 CRISPR-associated endonuclease Cas3'' [Halarchaeum sp. CBA1220]
MALDPEARYSHPPEDGRDGVLLTDHLTDVAERVPQVVPAGATTPAGESLRDVVRLLALVHDLGKATTFFQRYIDSGRRDPENDLKRYHAPLGAFAAFDVCERAGFDAETCLAGFVAVAKHHGRLPDVADYVTKRTDASRHGGDRRLDALAHQVVDIHEHDASQTLARAVYADATGVADDWTAFATAVVEDDALVERIAGHVATDGHPVRDALSEDCYALVLQCWSALVLADKTSAADAPSDAATYAPEHPDFETLDAHVAALEADADADPDGTRRERLNHFRSRARRDVLDSVPDVAESGGGVATLTLPTGMGKTLTGLSAAFALRDRLDGERVVYALPFTSVIDQVVADVEGIYDTDAGTRLLTAHHHLTETTLRGDEEGDADDADLSDDVAGMLAEAWRAGLTVTTFVQLFESLAGPQNTQSMKLPALHDAVIVLDEPQSLPLDWWKLAPRLVDVLTERYDATVVAMTATQPRLFDDATELVDDPDSYFAAVDRVDYALDDSAERYLDGGTDEPPKSHADAAADLLDTVAAGESALAVCNTIGSAAELTACVDARLPDVVDVGERYADALADAGTPDDVRATELAETVARTGRPALLHLSTRLRPADRLALVDVAKELTSRDLPFLTVSTQLVEAGVDISFDRVYRDLAPMDSVVQAAGRCNRSFERERGRVTVWWLEHPGDGETTPSHAVYNRGPAVLTETARAIEAARSDDGVLDETAVARDAVEAYYERLGADGRDVGEQTYADYVDDARADELGRLSLIDQRRSVDVLVCRTAADRERAEAIREAERAYEFDALERHLEETRARRVSVPVYRGDDETADAITRLPPLLPEDGLYELDVRDFSNYFDATTGFTIPESSVDHQFL